MSSDFEIGDFDPCPPSGVVEAMYAAGVSGRVASGRAEAARRREREVDRTLDDSFPASDPPGWTLGHAGPVSAAGA